MTATARNFGVATGAGSGTSGTKTWKTYTAMTSAERDAYLADMKAAGMNAIRSDCWVFDADFQARAQKVVDAGMHFLCLVRGGADRLADPTILDQVVRWGAPRGIVDYELGNEPNISQPTALSSAQWTTFAQSIRTRTNSLAATARAAATAVGQTIRVGSPALTSYGQYGSIGTGADAVWFLEQMLAAGAINVDFICVHPYEYGAGQTADHMLDLDNANPYSGYASVWGGHAGWTSHNTRKALTDAGFPSMLIMCTETGAPTSGGSYAGVSEAEQASLVTKEIADWASHPTADDFYWYSGRDYDTTGGSTDQMHFGIYKDDRTPKLARDAMKNAIALALAGSGGGGGGGGGTPGTLTLSGNEITDAVRSAGVDGDARPSPDSSMGVWRGTTNLIPLGSAETGPNASDDGFRVTAGSIAPVTWTEVLAFGAKAIDMQLPANGDMLFITATGPAADRPLVTAGTVYTFKVFEMAGSAGGEKVALGIQWYNAAGTFMGGTLLSTSQSADITLNQAVSGAPLRPYRLTATAPAGAVSALPVIINRSSPTALVHFQVDGAQFEAQPYPTPFKAGTRAAAQIQVPVMSLVTPTKGAFAFRVRPGWANNEVATGFRALFKWIKDASNDLAAWFDFPNSRWSGERVAAGSATQVNSAGQTFAAGSSHLIVFAWDATNIYISVNGGAFVSVGNTLIPSGMPGITNVLYDTNGSVTFDGDILWMMEMANVPTSGELTTLNALGDNDPSLSTLSAASPQLVWTAVNNAVLTATVAGASVESWNSIPI